MRDRVERIPSGDGEVVVLVDEPAAPHVQDVVLVSPFGMSAEDMFPAAYILCANGFRVARVDVRNHVGEGSGEISSFRLACVQEDIEAVLGRWRGAITVAISLAARSALRALGRADAAAAVLVTPVVDVQYTLDKVLGRDYFVCPASEVPPLVEGLGYHVKGSVISDCIADRFRSVDDAVEDARRIDLPIALIAGDRDPWVAVDHVRRVADDLVGSKLAILPAGAHELTRNPVVALRYLRAIAEGAAHVAGRNQEEVVVPRFSEIIRARSGDITRRRAPRVAASEAATADAR